MHIETIIQLLSDEKASLTETLATLSQNEAEFLSAPCKFKPADNIRWQNYCGRGDRGAIDTTMSGRPASTSKELILAEARRRLVEAPDSIPYIMKVWANDLSEWLVTAHPDAPRMSPRTVAIYLTGLHRIVRLRKYQIR